MSQSKSRERNGGEREKSDDLESRLEKYEQRYAPNWSQISKRCRRILWGRCANCWFRKARSAHHLMYSDLFGRIKGREMSGWHIVPLCDRCHDPKRKRPGSAHYRGNWVYDREDGLWGNRSAHTYRYQVLVKYWIFRIVTLAVGLILLPFRRKRRG